MFWGLSLWCFPHLRNPIPSVIFFFFLYTSVGYSHCFWLALFWNTGTGHSAPSESLVQQAESKLFHMLFI